MALANWPAFHGQQRSLRRMRRVFSWALARSPGPSVADADLGRIASLRSEHRRAVTAAHERAVLHAGGVVIRYGQLWGPGTYYPSAPPNPPRIHVDEAARQTLPALNAPPGLTIVADDRATHDPSPS
jgi:hypothetical protein